MPRTLNLGMGGIGPLHELAILKEYGSVVRPKVVLWVYYEGNDLADLSHEKNGFFFAPTSRKVRFKASFQSRQALMQG